jgi:hypothetical protein
MLFGRDKIAPKMTHGKKVPACPPQVSLTGRFIAHAVLMVALLLCSYDEQMINASNAGDLAN